MNRKIVHSRYFDKELSIFLKKRQLIQEDFDEFSKELGKNPELGDIVPGTGGVRKARIKSSSGGKSGGFRVCYYYLTERNRLHLIFIYAKNKQENLTEQEKKILKKFVTILKRSIYG